MPPLLPHEVLEARLKAQRSPRILHTRDAPVFPARSATQSDNGVVANGVLGAMADIGLDRLSAGRLENPFLRSGLALAGANAWLQRARTPSRCRGRPVDR